MAQKRCVVCGIRLRGRIASATLCSIACKNERTRKLAFSRRRTKRGRDNPTFPCAVCGKPIDSAAHLRVKMCSEACVKERERRQAEDREREHPGYQSELRKRSYCKHIDKRRLQSREYYWANRDRMLEQSRAYKQRDRAILRAVKELELV